VSLLCLGSLSACDPDEDNTLGAIDTESGVLNDEVRFGEAFLLIAENSLAMAARYQPELTNRETGEKQPNPNNEERYAFFC